MSEIWKDITGFEGLYKVSNKGNILSLVKNKILAPRPDKDGYLRITLCSNKKKKFKGIHCLVAMEFVNNPELKPQVNHKDFNTKNNYATNLEWVTDKENKEYSLKNGRKNGRKKGYKVPK